MTDEERAREDAIMKGWFAFNDYAKSMVFKRILSIFLSFLCHLGLAVIFFSR